MINIAALLHFVAIIISIAISTVSVGLSEGFIALAGIQAINVQPKASREINKALFLGMALAETAAILSFIIAVTLVLGNPHVSKNPLFASIAKMGIGIVICLTGGVIGIVSYLPAQEACNAIARQPFFSGQIIRILLLTLSLIQTSSIFGFIIAFLIMGQVEHVTSFSDSLRLLSGGLAVGLGSIGPAIGLGIFSAQACRGTGLNRDAYPRILSFTLLSEAIIETPIIFSLLVSLILVTSSTIRGDSLVHGLAFLAAALCIGISTFAPGINSGKTAAVACEKIAYNPELFSVISRTSLFAQGLLDTFAIYGLLISILLIFILR